MSDLEKYIQQNSSDFESIESFDEKALWKKIQYQRKRKIIPIRVYGIAATISLLVALGVSYWMMNDHKSSTPMLTSLEKEYGEQIDEKLKYIQQETVSSQSIEELLMNIDNLDTLQKEILQDANMLSDKERVLELLKRNYERKLKLIELLEKEIQIQKNEKDILNL